MVICHFLFIYSPKYNFIKVNAELFNPSLISRFSLNGVDDVFKLFTELVYVYPCTI